MAKCSVCGQNAGLMMNMCDACIDNQANGSYKIPLITATAVDHGTTVSYAPMIFFIGILMMGIGLYNLLNPTSPEIHTLPGYTQGIANLHKLFIGQTLSILGGIFSVAGAKSMKLI